MPLHLLRTAVGISDLDAFRRRQAQRLIVEGERRFVTSHTRRRPTRIAEILEGGSIYWIVKGAIRARQRVLDFVDSADGEGAYVGLFHLEAKLIPTLPVERKPFQGWRYLEPAAAPADAGGDDDAPAEMLAELKALGLI